ncbi:GDSL-type esterase/lipase family protein [Sphingomonas crocodyli]|uniref:Lipolytic enzyme n=1 Tax=Sphingomonas crocodyli TaxID=1979270 RepID=A0A437M9W3_9SPHN|nr:GDSL-type esterase/lipase family protein [Sphingomonas crocodyli]RVT94385.1 lipolytic enzyme [Sphingomonas crocodyli]
MIGRLFAGLAIVGAMSATVQAAAPLALPDPFARFAAEIEAFERADEQLDAPPGETMFVGSSSIRLWDTSHSFPSRTALNRGFGGATTPDVLHYYEQVVGDHEPATVVVYVGENDIAAGAEPEQVVRDVSKLLARIRADEPNARIVYISMKPSPSRWALWDDMTEVNHAMAARAGAASGFDYLDVASAMLTKEGKPDASLFGLDGLHMNARGYAVWTGAVEAWLKAPRNARPIESATRTTS